MLLSALMRKPHDPVWPILGGAVCKTSAKGQEEVDAFHSLDLLR